MTTMRLHIMTPGAALVDTEATKVTAEAVDGWFCLLPRHIDLVTALVAGLLVFEDADGQEHYVALDAAVLVKCEQEVLVSTPRAELGESLSQLPSALARGLADLDERERQTRAALRRLEATFLRGLRDLEAVGDA
jgi:F-type H+-transporting ATPase subunit epsilon